MTAKIIPHIVAQHAEEAAFLWLLRDAAVAAPHYTLKDLARLDDRVEAHVDGLRVAGEAGWALCEAALEHPEPGEVFAAAVLALESGRRERLERVLATVRAAPEGHRGLLSAFGWVARERLGERLRDLLDSDSAFLRRIGIAACAIRRAPPGSALTDALRAEDPALRARALRAVGELGRRDLQLNLRQGLDTEDPDCRFWSAWSAVLLGERGSALAVLRSAVTEETQWQPRAFEVVLRAMDGPRAQGWLRELSERPERHRQVILGAGFQGDPVYLPWLIERMEDPALARPAGEAFAMITGVDLAYEDLDGDGPAGFETGPTEDPEDEDVALDPDEDLPWPEPEKIKGWWDANKGRFRVGLRHLAGAPVSEAQGWAVIRDGYQRQRRAAALELALLRPDAALFEIRAPGAAQRLLLRGGARQP